jgi:hypothetical protein
VTGPAVAGLEGRLGFSITVPDSWFEIDVHPGDRDESIRRLVEDRVRGNQAMWEARGGIMKLLREQSRRAWESGATYCACMVTPTDDGPLTASVVVSLVRGPVGATEHDDPTGFLVDQLSVVPRGEEGGVFTSVTTVDLPGVGPCARSYGVEDVQVEGGWFRNVFMQTMVPTRGFNKVFLISCSSPVVPLAPELHDLFDAVTGTFRMVPLAQGEAS